MRKVAKTLAGVHTGISTKNKKLNKVNSVNKISAISSPKNKELYIA